MRVCVIGAAGQLGTALVERLGVAHEVIAAVRRDPRADQILLDLAAPETIGDRLSRAPADVVVIAGGTTYVDGCERDPAPCRRVNVDATRAVAAWAREAGATVVFYSTDHVFDGAAADYGEDDPPHPLNEYARTKLDAETVLRDLLPGRHLVIRTAWLFGPDPGRRNFALRLVAALRAGEEVRVPSDQWGTPTFTVDLAVATRHLLERGVTGTFHAAGPDFLDRVALARRVCARFEVEPAGILPTPTASLGQPAPRPLRVRLRCDRLRATGAPPFRGVDAGLEALRAWAEPVSAGARP